MCNKKITNIIATVIVVAVAGACCFFLVNSYPYTSDDILYRNITGTQEAVKNIGDIFLSQYTHWFSWGGRNVAHFVAQLLLLIARPISSIIITGEILFLAYMICKNAVGAKKVSLTYFTLAFSMIFLLNPSVEHTLLWITGSGNYLSTTIMVFVFIYPFRIMLEQGAEKAYENKAGIGKVLGMFFIGILAGWTNENLGAALSITMLIGIAWAVKFKKIKLPAWVYTGFIGECFGFLILIAAPGNYIRNAGELNILGSFASIILHRISMMERAIFEYMWETILLVGIFIIVKMYWKKKKLTAWEILLLCAGAFSYVTMAAAPIYPSRAAFCTICLLLVVGLSILDGLIEEKQEYKVTVSAVSAFVFAVFTCQSVTQILVPILSKLSL